jgi:hypothetical protein
MLRFGSKIVLPLSNDVALLIEINVNGQFSRGEGNVIVIFFHYAGVSIDCKIGQLVE